MLHYAALPLLFSLYSLFDMGLINLNNVAVQTHDGGTTMVLHKQTHLKHKEEIQHNQEL